MKKGAPPAKALVGRRKAIFAADGKPVNTPIYDGSKLGAGATIKGPAIIEEVTTTIVIEPKWTARLDVSGPGLWLAALGLVAGVMVMMLAVPLFQNELYGVAGLDAGIIAGAAGIILVVTVASGPAC